MFTPEGFRRFWERERAEATPGEIARAEALRDLRVEECPHCAGAGVVLVRSAPLAVGRPAPCICATPADRAALAGIPACYQGATLATFDPSPGKTKALLAAEEWDGRSSLVFAGSWGVGKTHLAAGLLQRARDEGIGGLFVSAVDFLDSVKALFGSDASAQEFILAVARTPGVLLLDDLGAERSTDFTRDQLATLLARRYADGRPTIITTNIESPAEVAERYGGGVASRLSQWHWIEVGGVDVRRLLGARAS